LQLLVATYNVVASLLSPSCSKLAAVRRSLTGDAAIRANRFLHGVTTVIRRNRGRRCILISRIVFSSSKLPPIVAKSETESAWMHANPWLMMVRWLLCLMRRNLGWALPSFCITNSTRLPLRYTHSCPAISYTHGAFLYMYIF
jgi:hypothetical protein